MRRVLLALLLCWPLAAVAKDYGMKAVDHTLTFDTTTYSPTTGEPLDADSDPTYRVYKDGAFLTGQTGTMTLTDSSNTDGYYTATLTLSDANGYTVDSEYTIRITATVGAVDGATEHGFTVVQFATVDGSGNIASNVKAISDDTTAADNLELATDGTGYNVGGGLIVSASVAGGINTTGGTITTLDGLDTAQDTQHGTTQTSIGALNDLDAAAAQAAALAAIQSYDPPTDTEMDSGFAGITSGGGGANTYQLFPANTRVSVFRADGAIDQSPYCVLFNATQVYGVGGVQSIAAADLSDLADDLPLQLDTIQDGNANTLPIYQGGASDLATLTVGAWDLHVLTDNDVLGTREAIIPVYWDGTTLREATADVREEVAAIEPGYTQPRQNYQPDFKLTMSNRRDGQFIASPRVRVRAGTVDATVGIDVAPLYGKWNKVVTVGTPVVESGSSITCTAVGPRDEPEIGKQWAMVQLAGTATLDEETTVDVPVTLESGASDTMRFIIEAPFAASGS